MEGAVLFYASISTMLGFALGAVLMLVLVVKMLARRGSLAAKIPAIRNPVSMAWAYDQVVRRIEAGASLKDVREFLADELSRLDGALGSVIEQGAEERDEKIARLERKLEQAQGEAQSYKQLHDELHAEACAMRRQLDARSRVPS